MGGAILSKSLIQFSIDGWNSVPSLLFDLMTNYGGGNEDNVWLLQKIPCLYCCTQCHQQWHHQATAKPHLCRRLLDTHWKVCDSLLWGHCSFLLGLGAHKILFLPSKSLFPQSCVSFVIKSRWPPKSNSLGILSPFAISPGCEICYGS